MSAKRFVPALTVACTLLVTMLPSAAVAGDVRYGRTHRADGVLHSGCHVYRFHYRLHPDAVLEGRHNGHSWAAEFFLTDPRREGIASDVKEYQADPRRGVGRFKFCNYSTRPGRFRIRARLTVKHTSCSTPIATPFTCTEHKKTVWIQPSRFRLRRR